MDSVSIVSDRVAALFVMVIVGIGTLTVLCCLLYPIVACIRHEANELEAGHKQVTAWPGEVRRAKINELEARVRLYEFLEGTLP